MSSDDADFADTDNEARELRLVTSGTPCAIVRPDMQRRWPWVQEMDRIFLSGCIYEMVPATSTFSEYHPNIVRLRDPRAAHSQRSSGVWFVHKDDLEILVPPSSTGQST